MRGSGGVLSMALLGLFAISIAGCEFQSGNSFSGDKTEFGPITLSGPPTFAQFQQILVQNCVSCHSAFGTYSEQDFVSNGYIIPGDPNNSLLYRQLQGSGTGGPENMPLNGAPLSAGELALIRDWVSSLVPSSSGTPTPTPTPTTGYQWTQSAIAVLQNNCASCHNQTSPTFTTYTTDAQFVNAGLVAAGNPSGSTLIEVLRGYGSIGTMPQGGGMISSSDEQTLVSWIQNISTSPTPSPTPAPTPSPTPSPSPSPTHTATPTPTPSPSPSPSHTATPSPTPTPSPSPSPTSTSISAAQRTQNAITVLKNDCASCHNQTSPTFTTYTSDSQFENAGLVVPGNPSGSKLIEVLRGYGSIGSMPQGGGMISSADEQTLVFWIQNIGKP